MKKYLKNKFFSLFKKFLKQIEQEKKEKNIKYNNSVAEIDSSAKIEDFATIANNQNNKSKIKIGKETWIKGQLLILAHGGEILIGDHCFVGDDSKIWSSCKITIGNRVLISHNVNIHDNVSHSISASYRHEEFKYIFEHNTHFKDLSINEQEVSIEDDVWIGFNAVILKGVTIGKGSIIGANTLITQSIPPYSVVVGNPAKVINQSKP